MKQITVEWCRYASTAHKCCAFSNFIEYCQSSIVRLTFKTSKFFNEINFCMVVRRRFIKLAFYTDLMCANLYIFRVSFSSSPYCILYLTMKCYFVHWSMLFWINRPVLLLLATRSTGSYNNGYIHIKPWVVSALQLKRTHERKGFENTNFHSICLNMNIDCCLLKLC